MAGRFVTVVELHHRLSEQGHSARSHPNSPAVAADVWPTPDTIVTVAVDPDVTLKPAYRDRYFACLRDAAGFPIAEQEPSLALPDPLARVAALGPMDSDFLAGPVRWLAARRLRVPQVLLWPDGEYRARRGLVRPEALAELPRLRGNLDRVQTGGGTVGALALDLRRDDDAAVFWEVAGLVGWSHENFYVSDEAAREVYLLHHHDKVVASVPDQHTRWLLLEELSELSDVFEDLSGYSSGTDDEDEPAGDEGTVG
jgi:hypothetical protein